MTNRPAKSRISVARNSHMPRRAACCCTSSDAKCAATCGTGGTPAGWAGAAALDCIGFLGLLGIHVEVGLLGVDGLGAHEVVGRRRGLGQPLVPLAVPGVGRALLAVHQRVDEVDGADE